MAVDAKRIERAFERAPVLVRRLAGEAPFASTNAVVERARSLIASLTEAERMNILASHPRIGADPRSLSADSRREQAGREDPRVLDELARLNDKYERHFGFRFVVFVARRPKAEILPVLRARLERSRQEELATGLDELVAIARDRLSSQ